MEDLTISNAVDRLLAGIEAGSIPAGIFASDAVLDATVPNWRFSVKGGEAVRHELGRWYADPGGFETLHRNPLPGGELVEFTLAWQEHGVAHACHQAHILRLANGQVTADTAFCGGRWPAPLLAEMQASG
jgi:hypothetical protein